MFYGFFPANSSILEATAGCWSPSEPLPTKQPFSRGQGDQASVDLFSIFRYLDSGLVFLAIDFDLVADFFCLSLEAFDFIL